MLAGAGLGDDAGLAHALRQHRLADGVVDLVRARMVQVLALEPNLGAAVLPAQALGEIQWGGAPDIVGEILFEGFPESGVLAGLAVHRGQLVKRPDQGFGHEPPAVLLEMPLGIRPAVAARETSVRHGLPPA